MPRRRDYKVYCLNCNKKLELKHYKNCNGKYNEKFCSRKCLGLYWKGKNHPSFKGGRFIDPSDGYVKVLIEGQGKYQLEQRYLIEKALGRKLLKGEIIHHIDGNRANNNLSNLLLMKRGEHTKLHVTGKPIYKNRRFKILTELPEPKTENEIVSLLPEYRTYKTTKCLICRKLFWHRKDYNSECCIGSCAMKRAWMEKDNNNLSKRKKKRCQNILN